MILYGPLTFPRLRTPRGVLYGAKEFNSQRDLVHLGRLTVARTRSQKDPPLVVQRPELLPALLDLVPWRVVVRFREIRQGAQTAILSKVADRGKTSKEISIQDWQEALSLGAQPVICVL